MENELEMSNEDSFFIEESSIEQSSSSESDSMNGRWMNELNEWFNEWIEQSSSSESESMNGSEDSDSDTEFDVNNSFYNLAIQPVDQAPDLSDADIIPWSKVMEEENGHFEVDFDTTTSGTKHTNI